MKDYECFFTYESKCSVSAYVNIKADNMEEALIKFEKMSNEELLELPAYKEYDEERINKDAIEKISINSKYCEEFKQL